jgi:hypothetical protein
LVRPILRLSKRPLVIMDIWLRISGWRTTTFSLIEEGDQRDFQRHLLQVGLLENLNPKPTFVAPGARLRHPCHVPLECIGQHCHQSKCLGHWARCVV